MQSGNSEMFGGRPSWKATRLQLQSGNSRFLVAGPVGRLQGYNCNLGTRDFFWWQAQLKGERGYKCNLGTRDFWGQAQLEGGRGYNCNLGTREFLVAGLVKRRQGYNCNLGTRDFFGGRPSWKATGLHLQSGNSSFFWWQVLLQRDRATTAIWELEIFWVAGPSWKMTRLQL